MGNSIEVKITKKMYGWSKWGGAYDGLIKTELDEWVCQFCARDQVKELPCYMIPFDEDQREFFRACSVCKNIALNNNCKTFRDLLGIIRR